MLATLALLPTGSPIPSRPPWLCPRPTGAPPPSLPAVGARGLSPPVLRPRTFGSLCFFGGVGARLRGANAPLLAITSPTGWGRGQSPEAPRRFCSCPLPWATPSPENLKTLRRSVPSLPLLDVRPSRCVCSVLPHGYLFIPSCPPPCRAVAPCRGLAVSVLAALRIRLALLVPRRRAYSALRAPLSVGASPPHFLSATALPIVPPSSFPIVRHSPSAHCIGVVPDIHDVTLVRWGDDGGREGNARTPPPLRGCTRRVLRLQTSKTLSPTLPHL